MNIVKKFTFFCFIFVAVNCRASDAVDDWIKKSYPEIVNIQNKSFGNIGLEEHIAAVIYNNQGQAGILLLKRSDKKQLSLVSKSKWWDTQSNLYLQKIKIKKQSIFYYLLRSGQCCGNRNYNYFESYQFKQQNGKFVLIGVDAYDIKIDADERYASKFGVSNDFLSNKRKEYRIDRKACKGDKNDFINCKTKKKLIYEIFVDISSKKLTPLDEFDVLVERDREV